MPIYEYHCKKCDGDFELMRPVAKMTSTAKCPNCGARATRSLSAFAVVRGATPDFDLGDEPDQPLGGGDDFDMGGMGDVGGMGMGDMGDMDF